MGVMYMGLDGEIITGLGHRPGRYVFFFSRKQADELFKRAFWNRKLPYRRWVNLADGTEAEYTEMALDSPHASAESLEAPHAERYADSVALGYGTVGRFEYFPTVEEIESAFTAVCDRCKQEKGDCRLVPYETRPTADVERPPAAIMCAACRRRKQEARNERQTARPKDSPPAPGAGLGGLIITGGD